MDFLIRKEGAAPRPLDPEAPARFIDAAMVARESVHATPGLGSDHRLRFRLGHGAALRVDETVVHLALFGGGAQAGDRSPDLPQIRRRHHRHE